MTEDATTVIGTIRKNASEDVRVALTTFHDVDLVDIRAFADFDNRGERRPTRKGLTIKIDRLPELIGLLQETQAEASRRGWITTELEPASS